MAPYNLGTLAVNNGLNWVQTNTCYLIKFYYEFKCVEGLQKLCYYSQVFLPIVDFP